MVNDPHMIKGRSVQSTSEKRRTGRGDCGRERAPVISRQSGEHFWQQVQLTALRPALMRSVITFLAEFSASRGERMPTIAHIVYRRRRLLLRETYSNSFAASASAICVSSFGRLCVERQRRSDCPACRSPTGRPGGQATASWRSVMQSRPERVRRSVGRSHGHHRTSDPSDRPSVRPAANGRRRPQSNRPTSAFIVETTQIFCETKTLHRQPALHSLKRPP